MTTPRRRFDPLATRWVLASLGLGLALGIYGFRTGSRWVELVAAMTQPLGTLWLNALQMTIVPLIVAQLLAGLVGGTEKGPLKSLGLRSVILFAGGLLFGGLVTLAVGPYLVRLYSASPEVIEGVTASVVVPEAAVDAVGTPGEGFGGWLVSLLPTNVFEAATGNQILPVLLVTVAFGLALAKLPEASREPVGNLLRGISGAMMIMVRWTLWGAPVGIFAMVLGIARISGAEVVGLLGWFVAILWMAHLVVIALVYPVASLLGGVSIPRFARGAAAAQAIGFSTRSSLAALPAHIEGGTRYLGFGSRTTTLTVPLAVTAFKLNTPVSMTIRALFLTSIYGVATTPGDWMVFLVTAMVLSFSSVGVPRGGTPFSNLPAYVALGVPLEGYIVLEVIRDVTDFIQTTTNVTGHAAAATILSRSDRAER